MKTIEFYLTRNRKIEVTWNFKSTWYTFLSNPTKHAEKAGKSCSIGQLTSADYQSPIYPLLSTAI